MRQGYVSIPDGWRRQDGRGLGPFVTREVFRRPDGGRIVWESRWHRKHPDGVPASATWWAPRAIAWWIGVLFAVGSACFAFGSFPPFATAVGTNADNLTYFIGSIFFTTAAYPAISRGRDRADDDPRAAASPPAVLVLASSTDGSTGWPR